MGTLGDKVDAWKPGIMMVMIQIIGAGLNIFYKLAANDGMSMKILVAYRFLISAAFIVPIALYVDRKSRPKLTKMVLWQAFLAALVGGPLSQNLYTQGLVFTSPTFATAMLNLNPGITFVVAILFRMEKLKIDTYGGKAKVMGTLIGIGGAMLLTFYEGPELYIWSSHINLLQHHGHQNLGGHMTSSHHGSRNYVMGLLLTLGAAISSSMTFIIQGKMSQRYPCHYSSSALISFVGAFQSVIFALCFEHDWDQWKLGWNIRLLSVVYGGIMGTAVVNAVLMMCVRMRGPLFISIFGPLSLLTVAIASSLLLDEQLYLGSVLGAVTIISGLYIVLWGKGREMKKVNQVIMPTTIPSQENEGVVEIQRNSSARSIVIVDLNFIHVIETTSLDKNASIKRCSSVQEEDKQNEEVEVDDIIHKSDYNDKF